MFTDYMSAELQHVIKDQLKKKPRARFKASSKFRFVHEDVLSNFVTATNVDLDWLKVEAKRLRLVQTVSGRNSSNDRIGFGLPQSIFRLLKPCPKTMFKFGRSKTTGLYNASINNQKSIITYHSLAARYGESVHMEATSTITSPISTRPKEWSPDDVNTLVQSRCQSNPPTFRNIAGELNRVYSRLGKRMDREFTARDCQNKWYSIFPSSEDANMTLAYLKELKKTWTGLFVFPKLDEGKDLSQPPKLTSLHIVWPWSTQLMSTLASSIFCDATYKVTVYNYKVVCITTLDGNKQHRPLMCSFISTSTTDQWATIFDMFHRVVKNLDSEFHVVTSDQEEAIRAGLRMSTINNMNIHFICSLHVKWNVRDHMCGSTIFGVRAAEIWSKIMQWADGKKAFEYGYRKMQEKFANDPARLQYIHELFKDPKKALWKTTFTFTNAVVVDVCECLFSALKTWVLGRGRQSVSLLMAVVRIVEGCRHMMLKPFLKTAKNICRSILGVGQPASVSYMFRQLASSLTQRSIQTMFDSVTKSWADYHLSVTDDNVVVTNRYWLHTFTTFSKHKNHIHYITSLHSL